MSEQGKAGNDQDSAISQQENCILGSELDEDGKSEQNQDASQQKKRFKSGGKGKLVRSLAVCEESSPRLETENDNQSP